jgi:hypothetical protein
MKWYAQFSRNTFVNISQRREYDLERFADDFIGPYDTYSEAFTAARMHCQKLKHEVMDSTKRVREHRKKAGEK